MARALAFVVFALLFIVFLVIKAVLQGGKAAYNAVFNPDARDEAVLRVLHMIYITVQGYMQSNYSGKTSDLRRAFFDCTNQAQKIIESNGFSAPIYVTERIVKSAIIQGGFVSADDFDRVIVVV